MKEFKLKKSQIIRQLLFGVMFVATGFIVLRSSIIDGEIDYYTVFMAVITIFGISMLSKPFMSYLKIDDNNIFMRDGLKSSRKIKFSEIRGVALNIMNMKMIIYLDNDKRLSFGYIYEDLKDFMETLAKKGVNMARDNGQGL